MPRTSEKRSSATRAASAPVAALCLLFCGCGGGGGGDAGAPGGAPVGVTPTPTPAPVPTPVPPAATSTTPLAINSANTEDALLVAAVIGEWVLQLGQLGVDYTRLVNERAVVTFSAPCRGGGSADFALTDPDANRVPTAGDTLRVTLRDCYSPTLDDHSSGELTYVLSAPSAGGGEAYAGTLTFGGGFLVGAPQGDRVEVSGSVRVDWRAQPLTTELQMTAAASNDLALSVIADPDRATERVRAPVLSKTFDYSTARTTNRLGFVLESELLEGRIEVQTPTPLSSFFGTYPDAGLLRVNGNANARAEAAPDDFRATGELVRLATLTGDTGATVASRLVPWNDLVEGFLWWEPAIGVSAPGAGHPASSRPLVPGFAALFRGPRQLLPVNSEIVLQFNQALSGAETFSFRLVPTSGSLAPGSSIATTSRVVGSRIVIKPARQLSHGTIYSIEKLSGRYIPQGGTTELNLVFDTVTTRNDLVVAVSAAPVFANAGATVVLDARASTSADGPIQGFRWRQVSGTPATLAGATTPTLSAALTRGPAAVETAVFEASVENAFGEVDTTLVSLEQVNDATATTLFYLRGSTGYITFDGRRQMRTPSNGQFSIAPGFPGLRLSHTSAGVTSSVDVAGTDDLPLAVGAYENATNLRPPLLLPPLLRVSADNTSCSGPGRFDVLEVSYGPGGEFTRLAIDFEHRCTRGDNTTSSPIFGSVRINSSRPIRE